MVSVLLAQLKCNLFCRKMLDNEECTPVQKSLRNDQVANLRLKNLELLTEMTSCLKDCTSKRYDLKVQSQVKTLKNIFPFSIFFFSLVQCCHMLVFLKVSTHIMQETSDPGASKIHLFYSYQKRIRQVEVRLLIWPLLIRTLIAAYSQGSQRGQGLWIH